MAVDYEYALPPEVVNNVQVLPPVIEPGTIQVNNPFPTLQVISPAFVFPIITQPLGTINGDLEPPGGGGGGGGEECPSDRPDTGMLYPRG